MRNRVAFVFVSSPVPVTPVDFDIEHSLLMQVRGSKTVSIGRFWSPTPFDGTRSTGTGTAPRADRGPAAGGGPRTPLRLAGRCTYPPARRTRCTTDPTSSMSVTLTYFTAATVRVNRIEKNLICLSASPPEPTGEPGRSAIVDTAKIAAMGVWAIGRRLRVRERSARCSRHSQGLCRDRAGYQGGRGESGPPPGNGGLPEAERSGPLPAWRGTWPCWRRSRAGPQLPVPATNLNISRWPGANLPLYGSSPRRKSTSAKPRVQASSMMAAISTVVASRQRGSVSRGRFDKGSRPTGRLERHYGGDH